MSIKLIAVRVIFSFGGCLGGAKDRTNGLKNEVIFRHFLLVDRRSVRPPCVGVTIFLVALTRQRGLSIYGRSFRYVHNRGRCKGIVRRIIVGLALVIPYADVSLCVNYKLNF